IDRARARADRGALSAVRLARRGRIRRQSALRDALPIRRPCGEGGRPLTGNRDSRSAHPGEPRRALPRGGRGVRADGQRGRASKGSLRDCSFGRIDAENPLRDAGDGSFAPRANSVGPAASLFPGTKALYEEERLVVSNWVGKFFTERITMTAPVLNNAARVMFLVQGEDKAPALKAVLEGPYEPEQLPAQLIQPHNGTVLWL